jgi:hypothetical protein
MSAKPGMMLDTDRREQFASRFMAAMLSALTPGVPNTAFSEDELFALLAKKSVAAADALIKALGG